MTAAVASTLVATLGLGAGGSAAAPGSPAAPQHFSASDLARLTSQLNAAVATAQKAADAADVAAQQDIQVRIALDDAAERADAARQAVADRITALYEAGPPNPVSQWLRQVTPLDPRFVVQAESAGKRSDEQLVTAADRASAYLEAVRRRSSAYQRRMLAVAAPAFAAEARARELLRQASASWATDQAALAAAAGALDAASAQIAFAVTPAVTERGRQAAAAEAPVIAALEAVPYGVIPTGFAPTGQELTGIASWYGPGFVGSPTSTGAPYDPERLTAAMLAVPLGTVVRVTSLRTGRSVCVLVDDHGPYVGGRVIDLSHAAAQAIGVSLGPVRIQVLQRS